MLNPASHREESSHARLSEAKVEFLAGQQVAKIINMNLRLLDIAGKTLSDLIRELQDRLIEQAVPPAESYE